MNKLKILISGDGLAGLTAAFWLHQYGHKLLVIARAPVFRYRTD